MVTPIWSLHNVYIRVNKTLNLANMNNFNANEMSNKLTKNKCENLLSAATLPLAGSSSTPRQ